MSQMSFGELSLEESKPLADRLRPNTLQEVVGQPQLTEENTLLYQSIKNQKPYSIIFYGPPGTGKTTLALIISNQWNMEFFSLNAVTDGIADLRKIIQQAHNYKTMGKRSVLFVDEIARWNKAQQDALLPYVEDGTIVLIGATTENIGFTINQALRSRVKIEKVLPLKNKDLEKLIDKALISSQGLQDRFTITEKAKQLLISNSGGDARSLLTGLEQASVLALNNDGIIDIEQASKGLEKKISGKSEHFHLASALQKSIRGSDPDAAIYWLARLEKSGEDPLFVARRLVVISSEDIGLASNTALSIASSAYQSVQILGAPECWIILAHVTIFLAQSDKNWSSNKSWHNAQSFIENNPEYPVPLHLRNSTTDPTKTEDISGYVHASQENPTTSFLPEEIKKKQFYNHFKNELYKSNLE